MLDFNQALKGLDGSEVLNEKNEPLTVGRLLSTQLASASKGDALKLFGWAQKLYNGEVLDIDKSDESTLKEFIKGCDSLTILAKAQMLSVFKD